MDKFSVTSSAAATDRQSRRRFEREHRRLLRIEAKEDRRAANEGRRQERREERQMRKRARLRARPVRRARRRVALSRRRPPDWTLELLVGSLVGVGAALVLVLLGT
jgi:hypothetical protein